MKTKTIARSPLTPKYLDISTAHITLKDSIKLNHAGGLQAAYASMQKKYGRGDQAGLPAGDTGPVIIHKYPEGYFIHVSDDPDVHVETLRGCRKAKYSEAFQNILRQAHRLGCWFVRLDRDGTSYSDLPTFKW